ncbi:hypothetical protein Ocin01_03153 [Orchesella cincta]|uniref:Uncharacterized protein n=1 Tax=Orchesella cincta TaxID=48709 RepID=A0A1D2NE32_ORCCI|nr:hypothetical protein Ocin01_03153 [Orchesella cincta]
MKLSESAYLDDSKAVRSPPTPTLRYPPKMEPGRRYESRSSNDEYRRIRHPNEGHPFVTSERGTERLDSATGHSFRSFTASNSSSSASGSDGTSTIMMRRCMITLYKNTVGRDPDEMAMEEINAVIHTEPDKRNLGNETRWMEKLKLHLIKQEKGNEAKRFMELYQKLKGMVWSTAC